MRNVFSWPAIKTTLDRRLTDRAGIVEAFRAGGLRALRVLEEQKSIHYFSTTTAFETVAPDASVYAEEPLSLSSEDIRAHSASYFHTYNPLFPILDPWTYFSETLPQVMREGIGDGNIESVIVLLVVALGQRALGRSSGAPLQAEAGQRSGTHDGGSSNSPGLETFNEAQKKMGLEMMQYTLEHVQMFSLAA